MLPKSDAESRWCPFALAQSDVKNCSFAGEWKDTWPTRTAATYQTAGNLVAVTVVNRQPNGNPHPDCLCITDRCVFWRKLDGTAGDCAKLDDNMNERTTEADAEMEGQWCPNARPENDVVNGIWGGIIAGCTVAVSSANRVPGNTFHPGSKCITSRCMAYSTNGEKGYCMDADSNMQR